MNPSKPRWLLVTFAVPAIAFSSLVVALAAMPQELKAPQEEPPKPVGLPEGADAMKIVVESVSGTVKFVHPKEAKPADAAKAADAKAPAAKKAKDEYQRLTTTSVLTHGDRIVGDIGSVCKLEFQHPTTAAALSAIILKGYTNLAVADAYLKGEQSTTKLEMTQGVIRAGVVKTATAPSYQVVTPRMVVGVRGTEIAEIESSNDMGDHILMGRVGIAMTHDAASRFRSQRAGQGTQKLEEPDVRGSQLLRAIEFANLEHRVFLAGPHRGGLETDYDRKNFDLYETTPNDPNRIGRAQADFPNCPFCKSTRQK